MEVIPTKTDSSETVSLKDIALMEFREKLFMEELEKYKTTLTGERESILPFVRDKHGNYSETKTWDFIHELMKYAHTYREYLKECIREEHKDEGDFYDQFYAASASFSKKEAEFLQSFFYCTIRIAEVDCLYKISETTQTFQDFLQFSEEHYANRYELYVGEVKSEAYRNNYDDLKGIYRPASWLTRLFTEKYLSDMYPENEEEEYFEHLYFELKEELKRLNCRPSEYGNIIWNEAFDGSVPMFTSEILSKEEKEWIKTHFMEQKQFVDHYLLFKNRMYEADEGVLTWGIEEVEWSEFVMNLAKIVRGAVRLFTESRGLSHIQDDNTFFTASTLLRQSNKRLQKSAVEDVRRR